MKYTLEVPDSYVKRLEDIAIREGISVRAFLVWLIKTDLDADAAKQAASQASQSSASASA